MSINTNLPFTSGKASFKLEKATKIEAKLPDNEVFMRISENKGSDKIEFPQIIRIAARFDGKPLFFHVSESLSYSPDTRMTFRRARIFREKGSGSDTYLVVLKAHMDPDNSIIHCDLNNPDADKLAGVLYFGDGVGGSNGSSRP